MRAFLVLAILSTVTCVSVSASAAIWYVDGSVSSSGDGKSWGSAFQWIQEGIEASAAGDSIIVAPGTYTENIHFRGKDITLTSTDPLDRQTVGRTVIDGKQAGAVVTFAGNEKPECLLSGFTIKNGRGGVYGWGGPTNHTTATIRNNIITENLGSGLVWCNGIIKDNIILRNSAAYGDGGGLSECHGLIDGNVVSGNTVAGGSGGGLCSCSGPIRRNEIAQNTARRGGGGLANCGGRVEDNYIWGNYAEIEGGGLSGCGGTIVANMVCYNYVGGDWIESLGGGGLSWCDGTVEGNVIAFNNGDASGGGLYECHGLISNNTISENSSWDSGGGLSYCDGTITGNTISGNTVQWYGGGLAFCAANVQGNRISENSAMEGGGLYDCDGAIESNSVLHNWSDFDGGGLYDCDGPIHRNYVTGNRAYGEGGGGLSDCDGTVSGNVICGNHAGGVGGGLQACDGAVFNNTVTGNSAGESGGGLYRCTGPVNCIICGNAAPAGAQVFACDTPLYCLIEGWALGGEGCIVGNPRFLDSDGPDGDPNTLEDNDYRLTQVSACIDAGANDDLIWNSLDLDGYPRVWKGNSSWTVDMGAYEYGASSFGIVAVSPQKGTGLRITWNSRPNDVYAVLSSRDLNSGLNSERWVYEAEVVSQGEETGWKDAYATGTRKFYRVRIERVLAP